MKILAGLAVLGVIAVVLVLLLTGEDEVKGMPLWVVVGDDDSGFGDDDSGFGNDNGGLGNIMFSKNGEKWTDSSDKGASFQTEGRGVAYGLGRDKKALWVAVGDNNTAFGGTGACAGNILYSTDGKKWAPSNNSGASFRKEGRGVAYGLSSDKKALWVAVGDNYTNAESGTGACAGNILYSIDGQKWTQSDDSGTSFRSNGNGVAYGLSSDKKTGLWVAVGDNNTASGGTGACAGNILFSIDGKKWTPSNSSGASFRRNGYGVAYGLSSDKKTGLWVAVGDNYTNAESGTGACAGNIFFSTDGQKWEQSDPSGASFRYDGRGVAYGLSSDKTTGLWVAVGDNYTLGGGEPAGNILFSTDGQKWTPSDNSGASFRFDGLGVAYGLDEDNNPLWVAVGLDSSAGNVLFSRDGQKWQQSDPSGASFTAQGLGAAFGKILNLALQ